MGLAKRCAGGMGEALVPHRGVWGAGPPETTAIFDPICDNKKWAKSRMAQHNRKACHPVKPISLNG